MKRYFVQCERCNKQYTVVIDDDKHFTVDELECNCCKYPEMHIYTKYLSSFNDAHPNMEDLKVKDVELIESNTAETSK